MIEHELEKIVEKMKPLQPNLGLLRGKMGYALFFYHYARHIDYRYEGYADKCLDEIIGCIKGVNCSYADGLAGIGAGLEYLVQRDFIDADTNEALRDFDEIICRKMYSFPHLIDIETGTTGYGKYFLSRLNNPSNRKNTSFDVELIKSQLSKVVDSLSANYLTFEDLFTVIGFLPDIINLDINKEKASTFLNYAVDLLETMVYEDTHFGKYPGTFNPLVAAILLFRSSAKIGNRDLADRASYLLEKYEPAFQPYLAEEHAVKWSFLYHVLWKTYNRDVYKKLSARWLVKAAGNRLEHGPETWILSGMMLLTMNNSIKDNWLDLFPLF